MAYIRAIGTSGQQEATSVAVNPQGTVYVAGRTNSADFPVTGGATEVHGQTVFAVKFAADGTIVYSTLIGSAESEMSPSIAADSAGNAYVSMASHDPGERSGVLVSPSDPFKAVQTAQIGASHPRITPP